MTAQKEAHVNCWELCYIQTYQQQNLLTGEQNLGELKPLRDILRYSEIQRAWFTPGTDLHCLFTFAFSTYSPPTFLHNPFLKTWSKFEQ